MGTTEAGGTIRHTGRSYNNAQQRHHSREGSSQASLPGSQPGLSEPHFLRRAWNQNLRAGGTAHLTRASSDSSGSRGFGADKRCTGKGWGSPSRGQQSQLAPSIVLSFLQQDARSPAARGSFVFIPSTITRCWPFSWALFRATGYSLCQERRKEAGREGGK